jgi:ATP-binding cassette subfamily G (WHITE) protein 2 (SNQ2)
MLVVTFDMPGLTQKKWPRRIEVNLSIMQKVCYKRGIRHTTANALLILDDIHLPTLTVGQTLNFALSTKTPGPKGRLPGISRSEFNVAVKDMLLKMLNIVHTENTLVGDSFVRGVSGGERKRVSIAEMMTTRARVQCWDNSSRGLDASTALDFVRSLRIMTDVLGQTTFATL